MHALWLEERALSLRDDLPAPSAPPGEALVRVTCAGICNTDLELCRGYYPYAGVLGHEFVGVVESGPDELRGRRVVGEINAVCGECDECREGRRTHCARRTVLGIVNRDGAFAHYLTLPVANLHAVPDDMPDEVAVFTEPVAAALEILGQVEILPSDRVLVVGDGKLGLLVAQALARTGCRLLAVGRHPDKLAILERRGIDVRTIARDAEPADAIDVRSFDVAVECTGNALGFETARLALRPRGTLVMKSTYAGRLEIDAAAVVVDELTLVGSRCGPFVPALGLLANGGVDVEAMIHARYPLEEGIAAFEHAARPGTLKVLLDFPNPSSSTSSETNAS